MPIVAIWKHQRIFILVGGGVFCPHQLLIVVSFRATCIILLGIVFLEKLNLETWMDINIIHMI